MTRHLHFLLSRIGIVPPGGLQGIGWVAASVWGTQAVRLATLAVLANFLVPATFGFFTFALAIFTVAQPVVGLGLSGALVVKPELEENAVATALATSALAGLAGMIVLFAGLTVMRGLDPQLDQLRVLGFMIPGLLFANIANAALAMPRRDKNFRALGMAMLGGEIAGSAVGIGLAVAGQGIESLVWRYVVTAGAMALFGLWLVRSHVAMPRVRSARSLLRYGLPVAGSETLAALRNRGDELLIGALFGATVLGVYSIARRYVDALRAALPAVIGEHAWPVLASLRDHNAAFARQLRRSLLLVAGFVWPAFAALAVLASQWIPALLGPEWSPAIRVVRVLCVVAVIQSALAIPVLAVVGLGHTAARLRMDIALTLTTLIAIVALARFGMPGLLGAFLVANLLILPYQFRVVSRHLPTPLRDILSALLLPLVANLLLVAALALLVAWGAEPLGRLPTLAIGVAMSGLVPLAMILRRRWETARIGA